MLSFTINKKKTQIRNEVIASYDWRRYIEVRDGVMDIELTSGSCSSVFENDVISFLRMDREIQHYDEKFVEKVGAEDEHGVFHIQLSAFSDIQLKAVEAKMKTIGGVEYLFLTFDREHYANESNTGVKRIISYDSEIEELCIGDVFVKDEYFKYRKTENSYENVTTRCYLYWYDSLNENVVTEYAYVPCTIDGVDMKKTLALDVNENTRMILNNFKLMNFWVKDLRFFTYQQFDYGNWRLVIRPGTEIRIRKGEPVINFGIDTDFSPYLQLNDGVKQFLEDEAKKKVTPAIDYEKQQFVPVVFGDEEYDVNKISFYIHLRERSTDWSIIPTGKWIKDERFDYCEPDNAIGNYDFDTDDIYYQRKCVSETFLRLSFYDDYHRGTQKLLYTAKLYLDDNRLWTEYVKQNGKTDIYLPFMFSCTNKYDYNNKTEGFYLHLFPSNIKELETAIIYMKVDLCHAKYGKTIPLTLPVYPNTYTVTDESTGEDTEVLYGEDFDEHVYYNDGKVDMKRLNGDMYIKVYLKHDGNRYVWSIGKANMSSDADELVIHLFEPKMF